MSKWIERFNAHPLTGLWANLNELIHDKSLDDAVTEDTVEDIARLRKVISRLNSIYESIDPEVTPFNHLTTIQKTVQACINELNAYKGGKNPGHLTNVNNNADALLLQFQQIPASVNALSNDKVKESVSVYSETIGSYISKFRIETEHSVEKLAKKVESLNGEIRNKEKQLSGLNSQIQNVEQTIQKQTTEFNTQYQTSEKERKDKFEKELITCASETEQIIKKYAERSDEQFKLLSVKAGKIIEVLTNLQDDASKVYGVTINTLQAGAYSSYADDEEKLANKYRTFASLLMLFGVGFLVFPELRLIIENGKYAFDWLNVVGRLPLSLIVFVPAFYFAKESGKHRVNEMTNRRRQHILSTLDPYIELMKKEDADELRVHVAKTIFSENLPLVEHKGSDAGNDLSQFINVFKRLKSS